MKYFIVVVAIIACINAAPTPQLSQGGIADMKEALQPVQKNMRAMYDNAEFAIKDLAQVAVKSAVDLTEDAKKLSNPLERSSLSRNYLAEAKSLINDAQVKSKNLLERAITDYQPIKANQRSALISSKDALRMLEQKYLTPDGQQLVKTLTRMVPMAN